MQVQVTRHLDASEPDASGLYDYWYEYDTYCFSAGSDSLVARSYTDEPAQAHFLSIECKGASRRLVDDDLRRGLFVEALAHLRSIGKQEIRWLSGRGNGYEVAHPRG